MKLTGYKIVLLLIILFIIYYIISNITQNYNDKYRNTALYPPIQPLSSDYIQVSQLHKIYYLTYGNPNGKPILFVHGGPGFAPDENAARFFNPKHYYIIIVHQRGAGKSIPAAELKENTTQNLIEDFEKIRKKLNIDKWILFGASWGTTLSLAYSITYPQVINAIIIRGIYLATPEENEWIWGPKAGLQKFNPIAWDYFEQTIPSDKATGNYIIDYNKCFNGLFGEKKKDECLIAWDVYENSASHLKFISLDEEIELSKKNDNYKQFSIIENYYVLNHCFLEPGFFFKPKNINRIQNIPTIIIQGKYDLICPPISAYKLHKMLPNSQLHFTLAGHSLFDDENIKYLVRATDSLISTP